MEEVHQPSHSLEEGETPYWRQFRNTSEGGCVCGIGPTKEEAIANAQKAWQLREDYLAKPDAERLSILLGIEDLCQRDMNEAIHIIGKLVLDMDQWRPSVSLQR